MPRRLTIHPALLATTLLALALPAAADGDATEIILVRHAQTMANVLKKYDFEYQHTFSERGLDEIAELTKRLAKIEVDHVLVSPTWRTQHTIAPYLRKHFAKRGRHAEIWPEIEECCYQADRKSKAAAKIARRGAIAVDEKVDDLFRFRGDASSRWFDPKSFADSEAVLAKGCALLRKRFAKSGDTIVVVSHFATGARLVACLTGDQSAKGIALENAALTRLREQPDGRYELVTLNDEPVEKHD